MQVGQAGAGAPLEHGPVAVGHADVGGADLAAGAGALDGEPDAGVLVQGVGHADGIEAGNALPA